MLHMNSHLQYAFKSYINPCKNEKKNPPASSPRLSLGYLYNTKLMARAIGDFGIK